MYPDRKTAEQILREGEKANPGPWAEHSRTAARCAERIAFHAGLDPDKAYVLGLLHDIGRKFGKGQMRHIMDGYTYMMSLGYDDAARICLTHSFNGKRIEEYPGLADTAEEETEFIITRLQNMQYDDYDRLIQLCDAVSGTTGAMDIIDRMNDVKKRYGAYDQQKWDTNLVLKEYFETKMGRSLEEVI